MITHLQQLTRYRAICCGAAAKAPDHPEPAIEPLPEIPPHAPAQHVTGSVTGIVREDPPRLQVISASTPPGSGPTP